MGSMDQTEDNGAGSCRGRGPKSTGAGWVSAPERATGATGPERLKREREQGPGAGETGASMEDSQKGEWESHMGNGGLVGGKNCGTQTHRHTPTQRQKIKSRTVTFRDDRGDRHGNWKGRRVDINVPQLTASASRLVALLALSLIHTHTQHARRAGCAPW